MALKKRGFNVDRILNQQREEKLRIQAEAVRDRERVTAAETQLADDQSVLSETTSSTAVDTDSNIGSNEKSKSLLERFKRSSKDMKGNTTAGSASMPPMPGGLTNGLSQLGLGHSGPNAGGMRSGAGPGQSTKRVGHA